MEGAGACASNNESHGGAATVTTGGCRGAHTAAHGQAHAHAQGWCKTAIFGSFASSFLIGQPTVLIRRTLPSFSGVGNASDLDESRGLLPLNLRPLAKRSAVGGKGVCAWTNPNPLGGGLACQRSCRPSRAFPSRDRPRGLCSLLYNSAGCRTFGGLLEAPLGARCLPPCSRRPRSAHTVATCLRSLASTLVRLVSRTWGGVDITITRESAVSL